MTKSRGTDAHVAPACLVDDYRRRRVLGSPDPRNAHRKAALQISVMFCDIAVTVYAACVLVAGTSHADAALPALLGGAAAALGVVALRLYVPPRVRPREPEVEETPREGGWDVGSFLLASVVVPPVVLAGLLLNGWLMVAVVLGFALFAQEATLLGVLAAVAVSIAASACVELAVVHPLLRRWGIAPD